MKYIRNINNNKQERKILTNKLIKTWKDKSKFMFVHLLFFAGWVVFFFLVWSGFFFVCFHLDHDLIPLSSKSISIHSYSLD